MHTYVFVPHVCTILHKFPISLNSTFSTWKKHLLDIQNLRHLMEIKDRKILSCFYERWKKDMLDHVSANKATKHHQQVTTAWCFRAWQSKFLHTNKLTYTQVYSDPREAFIPTKVTPPPKEWISNSHSNDVTSFIENF